MQETFIRAWRGYERFEGRSALRSWLYRIATNVCFDMLDARKRRARPMDLGPAGAPIVENLRTPDQLWIEPMPDGRVVPDGDPADIVAARESVRLAFVAALQQLPPRQRAVLILCEVLRWKAAEVAELLETSVASVNSALQRARATLEASPLTPSSTAPSVDAADAELLQRYVDAFERYDMDALTALIHEDATQSMPPFDMWLAGRDDILTWWVGPGNGCRGSRVDPGRVRERRACVRSVQARGQRGGLRAVGAAGAGDRERPHRRAHLLPRRGYGVPTLRAPARVPRRLTSSPRTFVRPISSTSSRRSSAALQRWISQPRRRAASWRRASASTVTASGSTPATSQATTAPLRPSTAQTRSQRPGRSPRLIGPRMAKATSCDPGVGMRTLDRRQPRKSSHAATSPSCEHRVKKRRTHDASCKELEKSIGEVDRVLRRSSSLGPPSEAGKRSGVGCVVPDLRNRQMSYVTLAGRTRSDYWGVEHV